MVAQLVERHDVGAVEQSLAHVVGSLDVDAVAACDAPDLWQAFDRIERLASSAKTLLAAKVEKAGTWKRDGYRSAAEHLARLGGTSVRDARGALDASKRLAALPATSEAVRRGALSAEQVEAVAAAAIVNPTAEPQLLALAARTNVAELREECQRVKVAADPDPDATHRRIHAGRSVRTYRDGDGAWNCHVRGTAERGAAFEAKLERLVDEEFKAARAEDRREPREAYLFDALMKLADGPTPASKNPSPRYLAVLRADLPAVARGTVADGEVCEIAGVGPIPVSVARGLLGDSVLKLVITKGVDVANVVHLGRGPTAAQRIALLWTSPKCSNEACSSTFGQIDHREPWATTKHTVLSELDRLCTHDHRLKTTRGWSLVSGTGRRAFVPPHDPRHPRHAAPP